MLSDVYFKIADSLRTGPALVRLLNGEEVEIHSITEGQAFWSRFDGCNMGSRRIPLNEIYEVITDEN